MTHDPADGTSSNTPRSLTGFGRAPDPVDTAIMRHRARREDLQHAADAVDAAGRASKQVEAEANAALTAAGQADGAAWADLLATRPADVSGAVRLLRYVSVSPASEVLEDPHDLLRQLTEAVAAAEAAERPAGGPSTVEPVAPVQPDPALAVTDEFRRVWDAANAAARAAEDGDVPEEHLRAVDEASASLRAVRPTTPAGFRALASTWAYRLGGDLRDDTAAAHAAASLIAGAGVCVPSEPVDRKASPVDWHAPQPGFMASPAIEPYGFVLIPEGISIELGRLRGIALAEFERCVEAGVTGETKERLRRALQLDALSKAARGEGRFDIPLSAPRDWQAEAARHPGFVPYPAHAPSALVALDLAIQGEAARMLALAEAEVERRRQDYAGCRDPQLWPRVERCLRREMRMDALAAVARDLHDGDDPDPVLAAIAASRAAEAEMKAFSVGSRGEKPADWIGRERELCRSQNETREAVWGTVPTTHAGRVALADYARFQVDLLRGHDGRVDCAEGILSEILGALEAAIRGERPEMVSVLATDPDAALLALGPTIAALITARDAVPPEHEEAHAKIDGLVLDEGRRLAAMPARTLAGLVLKARFVERGADEELKDALVADLLALGGGE